MSNKNITAGVILLFLVSFVYAQDADTGTSISGIMKKLDENTAIISQVSKDSAKQLDAIKSELINQLKVQFTRVVLANVVSDLLLGLVLWIIYILWKKKRTKAESDRDRRLRELIVDVEANLAKFKEINAEMVLFMAESAKLRALLVEKEAIIAPKRSFWDRLRGKK